MKINNEGLKALTVECERAEIEAIGTQTVKLKRTFNQPTYDSNLKKSGTIKFWRVIAPASHRNFESDLSIEGLKQWGIVK